MPGPGDAAGLAATLSASPVRRVVALLILG